MALAWILFIIYLLGTSVLGWLGHKKTSGFSSFAIGQGNMSPVFVGVTLAAATASAATFIINPGFVYVDGLAAFMHLGAGVYIGFTLMLIIMSFKFRQIGSGAKALTIPDWIGKRFRSRAFSMYFAFLNLLSFAFIVLLVGGISIVMQSLLGVSNLVALLITLIFVTSYVLVGGTYAHVYTNLFQGALMIFVSLLVLGSGLSLASFEEMSVVLRNQDPQLLSWVHKGSDLFGDWYSVYVAGFCIGAALVCQPHILTKALYVESDRDVWRYILVFSIVFLIFIGLLLSGFFAHLLLEPDQLLDPATGEFRQDLVMTKFLEQLFPDWLFTVISVVLLAAAMSTLDGLLVGISTIIANDLILNVLPDSEEEEGRKAQMKKAMLASQVVLLVLAVATFIVNLNPPKLLGIFGQVGVYGLVLSVVSPLLIGIWFQKFKLPVVWGSSVLALLVYFGLYFFAEDLAFLPELAWNNPAVAASFALFASVLPSLIFHIIYNNRKPYA